MPDYNYQLGTTEANMVNIETLVSAVPSGVIFTYYPVSNVGGTGIAEGEGYPSCIWIFDYLSWTDYVTMLNYFGTAESVSVYINTRRQDNTYATYTAVMHRPRMPQDARQGIGGWTNIIFRFTHLVTI